MLRHKRLTSTTIRLDHSSASEGVSTVINQPSPRVQVDAASPVPQQFIKLTNEEDTAVDLSGWRLEGATAQPVTLPPGTVAPRKGSVYVASDAAAFRKRPETPTGGEGKLVVQGAGAKQGAPLLAPGKERPFEFRLLDGAGAVVFEGAV